MRRVEPQTSGIAVELLRREEIVTTGSERQKRKRSSFPDGPCIREHVTIACAETGGGYTKQMTGVRITRLKVLYINGEGATRPCDVCYSLSGGKEIGMLYGLKSTKQNDRFLPVRLRTSESNISCYREHCTRSCATVRSTVSPPPIRLLRLDNGSPRRLLSLARRHTVVLLKFKTAQRAMHKSSATNSVSVNSVALLNSRALTVIKRISC